MNLEGSAGAPARTFRRLAEARKKKKLNKERRKTGRRSFVWGNSFESQENQEAEKAN
jgi:hypothetical protein